jgi:hypothetical protein
MRMRTPASTVHEPIEGRTFRPHRYLWALGCSWLLLFSSGASPLASEPARDDGSADRLRTTEGQPLTQYRAYRRMHARSERFNQEAWLEAWTELDQNGFRYEIVSERGSDHVRNKVLKEVLRREQEIIASGGSDRAELSPANYEFQDAETHGPGVRYILLKPKRKDVLLVDGRMVLSQDGSELLRVEGRLSKNPSFWTSLVNIIREFARLDGVRVPIATETIAKVKFAGLSRMEVHYEYESINGRPVSLAARRMLAAAAAGR